MPGSNNDADPAEPFRLFDGLTENNDGGDDGVAEDGVMTVEVGGDTGDHAASRMR